MEAVYIFVLSAQKYEHRVFLAGNREFLWKYLGGAYDQLITHVRKCNAYGLLGKSKSVCVIWS